MVASEAAEGSRTEGERERAHMRGPASRRSGSIAPSIAAQLIGLQLLEPLREPGRAALADGADQALSLRGQREADTAPVDGVADADELTGALEPVDVGGEGGCGDPFRLGERTQRQAGARLDEEEQRRLPGRDTELLGLLPQLARDAEHDRAEVVGEVEREIHR